MLHSCISLSLSLPSLDLEEYDLLRAKMQNTAMCGMYSCSHYNGTDPSNVDKNEEHLELKCCHRSLCLLLQNIMEDSAV